MATGISTFGWRKFSGSIGWENNELHAHVYLADPAQQLVPFLQQLYGEAGAPSPMAFPDPFSGFYAFSMNFECEDRGAQQETEEVANWSPLKNLPTLRGGVKIDVTFRPMDDTDGWVTDENGEVGAQLMNLVGNNYGTNPASLTWNDGTPITNLSVVTKIIPKIQITQKQIYVTQLPNQTQQNLIGCVNDGTLFCGAAGNNQQARWPEECVLLTGLPWIRRWRFDRIALFEIGIKLAINMYQDVLEGGDTNYVTWNRLYRNEEQHWDKALRGPFGPRQLPLYSPEDLSQVIGAAL